MKIVCVAVIIGVLVGPGRSQRLPEMTSPFQGRWDMVLTAPDGSTSPRWMDYVEGRDPLIRIQPRGGSVHPAYDVNVDGPHITLVMDKANAQACGDDLGSEDQEQGDHGHADQRQ